VDSTDEWHFHLVARVFTSCGPACNIEYRARWATERQTLAAIAAIGTACWALVAFGFGMSIGNVLDPRPLSHVVISMVLVVFSVITLWRKTNEEHSPMRDATAALKSHG
jgi:hypothetical protein